MGLLYAVSGITVVRPDQVAVVLRWGRLVGASPALQQHGPGLLLALPRPIDQVIRVPIKRIWEVPITALSSGEAFGNVDAAGRPTLDPLTEGYALTGDQNIVQADMVARYRVRDPAEWAFYGPKAEEILRVEVTSATVRSLGEIGVDQVLSEGRERLVALVTRRTQAGLDRAHSGLELSSLELTRLAPPQSLATDFDSVQSAFIAAGTQQSQAQAYAAEIVPAAKGEADKALQASRGQADAELAAAKGHAEAFRALETQYRADPTIVRERLYRDAVERAIRGAGRVQWIPPPQGGNYHGFRITVQQSPAGSVSAPPGSGPSASTASSAGSPSASPSSGSTSTSPAMVPKLPAPANEDPDSDAGPEADQ